MASTETETMTTHQCRVGIGMPVYNGERFLAQAIESLQKQTWQDFVLVIGDNGSTDRTQDIACDYASSDRRIRYLRQPVNGGAARNFNRVFLESSAEFFRWHAADDISLPRYLELAVEALEDNPKAVLAYCRTSEIDASGTTLRGYEDRMHVTHSSPRDRLRYVLANLQRCNALYGLMRSSAVSSTRLIQPFPSSDMVFLYEMSLYGQFLEIPDRLFLRRMHEKASSALPPAALAAFYSGASRLVRTPRNWYHLAALAMAVRRFPTTIVARNQLFWEILNLAFQRRRVLAAEVPAVFQSALRHCMSIYTPGMPRGKSS